MSQLLATLYPDKFGPPQGTLVPRARVIPTSADYENAEARKQSVIDNLDMIYDLIKCGVNTSAEVSDHTGYTKAHVSGYFRRLEADGRCYRIEGKSNEPVRMFAY
jgi:hypothetical protein